MSGERGEEFGVDRSEEAFDLASALGPLDCRVDDADSQLDGSAFEVVAGEVGTVVDMEDVRNTAHRPCRIGLSPDGLAESEGRVERRGRAREHGVSANRP